MDPIAIDHPWKGSVLEKMRRLAFSFATMAILIGVLTVITITDRPHRPGSQFRNSIHHDSSSTAPPFALAREERLMTVAANPRPPAGPEARSAALGFAQVVVERVRHLPETIGAWFSKFGEPNAKIATAKGAAAATAPMGKRIALYQNDTVRKFMQAYTEDEYRAMVSALP